MRYLAQLLRRKTETINFQVKDTEKYISLAEAKK